MSNVTKEGVVVKVGQIWEDLDTRMGGRRRRVVDVYHGMAVMGSVQTGSSPTKVQVKRMHKCSTGWKLVEDVA